MTNPGDPIDLSILAQVSGPSPRTDTPPTLPDGARADAPPRTAREARRTAPTESGGAPAQGSAGAARPRSARASQPRSDARRTEDSPPRRVTADDALPEYRPGILVKPLTDLYVAVGTMMLPVSSAVGTAFVQNAGTCAESLDELARTNPRVRAVLMGLLTTGAWGKVIAAHMPILLAIGVTYSPQVRRAMGAEPIAQPDMPHDATDTVNPVSNGFVRDNRDVRNR